MPKRARSGESSNLEEAVEDRDLSSAFGLQRMGRENF
jgi:hypothetical protein